jgi:hypothetical protein
MLAFILLAGFLTGQRLEAQTPDIPAGVSIVSQAGENAPGPTMEYDLHLVSHFVWFQDEG